MLLVTLNYAVYVWMLLARARSDNVDAGCREVGVDILHREVALGLCQNVLDDGIAVFVQVLDPRRVVECFGTDSLGHFLFVIFKLFRQR